MREPGDGTEHCTAQDVELVALELDFTLFEDRMPDLLTTITEIVTGLGTLADDMPAVLRTRRSQLRNLHPVLARHPRR